ncbi:hypothetical protein PR048_027764 [Dryococelus australis]|uniref:Uncharacterized protein n=1 Tax=Dryococelus australis TaxID=614101 RepID=A0ABQ9GHD8_9NEOP|nr:hypothetical protein PR048_027764 [Dryococelus australis]
MFNKCINLRQHIDQSQTQTSITNKSILADRETLRKIAEMTCFDLHPSSTVEDSGFYALISHLKDSYEMVSRKFLHLLLSLSITSNIWTSRAENDFPSITELFP